MFLPIGMVQIFFCPENASDAEDNGLILKLCGKLDDIIAIWKTYNIMVSFGNQCHIA